MLTRPTVETAAGPTPRQTSFPVRQGRAAQLAVLVLFAAASAEAQAPSELTLTDIQRAIRIAVPSAVLRESPGTIAAGVIIETRLGKRVLTVAHGFRRPLTDAARVTLHRPSDLTPPKTFQARVIPLGNGRLAWSQGMDLAVLEPTSDAGILASAPAIPLRNLVRDPIQVGDPVIVVGSPKALAHSVSTGAITIVGAARNPNTPEATSVVHGAMGHPGNSGGPVYGIRKDARGELIVELLGVNAAGISLEPDSSDQLVAFGICASLAIDIPTIRKALSDWGLPSAS